MKQKLMKKYLKRTTKIPKSNLNSANTIMAINSRVVTMICHSAGIIKWAKPELEGMDRNT